MIGYNDLYEILRKEKYSEPLQILPKKFLVDFAEYLSDKTAAQQTEKDLFADSVAKSKKQLENAVALFKELILRRKKKILNLIFVATETGIMKRDYENMLPFEREVFERVLKAFEDGDRELAKTISSKQDQTQLNKMILFAEDVDQFVDSNGSIIGPFKKGELVNIGMEIAKILVSGEKATFIEED
jgi:DNA replication initiation complex subunit (GINS family)